MDKEVIKITYAYLWLTMVIFNYMLEPVVRFIVSVVTKLS